jgi:molybdenum cofactor biosynthesis enzyme
MVYHMKTTLNISDETMRAVKQEALHRGQTMSALVEAALRGILTPKPKPARLPPLPEMHSGGVKVDVADRRALYDAMED